MRTPSDGSTHGSTQARATLIPWSGEPRLGLDLTERLRAQEDRFWCRRYLSEQTDSTKEVGHETEAHRRGADRGTVRAGGRLARVEQDAASGQVQGGAQRRAGEAASEGDKGRSGWALHGDAHRDDADLEADLEASVRPGDCRSHPHGQEGREWWHRRHLLPALVHLARHRDVGGHHGLHCRHEGAQDLRERPYGVESWRRDPRPDHAGALTRKRRAGAGSRPALRTFRLAAGTRSFASKYPHE